MADYYTEYSFALEATEEQAEWIIHLHDELHRAVDRFESDNDADVCSPGLERLHVERATGKYVNALDMIMREAIIDILYESDLWPNAGLVSKEPWSNGVWFHDDAGTGDLWVAAEICQAFLRRFDPDKTITFEWANTCSRPRIDSFGGGACLVTATDQHWFIPSDMVADKLNELKAKKESEMESVQ